MKVFRAVQGDQANTTWGLPEAGIAWTTSTFVGGALFVTLVQAGGFTASVAARPGGHLGRAVGQLVTEQELVDRSIPVALQLSLLIPGWVLLLGTAWVFAGILGRDRTGWSIQGRWSDVPAGIATGLVLQIPILPIVLFLMETVVGEVEPTGRALALVDGAASSPLTLIMLIVLVAIGAPVVEEIFYRGPVSYTHLTLPTICSV